MTTYQMSIVAGVFQNEAQVKEAVNGLRDANFRYDQIGVAMANTLTSTSDLRGDLLKLGVPQERADYYDGEYSAGHVVVSVRPDGRDDEAMNILRSQGADNCEDILTNRPSSIAPTHTNAADDEQHAQPATEQSQAADEQSGGQEQPPHE
jgi:hypothetical protein